MSLLLSVPAGRSFRRPQHRYIDPTPDKGLIEMQLEDDLMHLWWKNRHTGARQDELIVFPGEATFEKVTQDPSGRTHILKFSSSDQKYFFWFQRASSEDDLRAMVDINGLLQDPEYTPGTATLPDIPPSPSADGAAPPEISEASASTPSTPVPGDSERSWPPTPGAPRLSHREPGPPGTLTPQPHTPAGMRINPDYTRGIYGEEGNRRQAQHAQQDMARLLVEWAESGGLGSADEDARLTDVLSPINISTLLASHPTLIGTIYPLLPGELDLPSNPTAQDLLPILSAPQFTDAIASLDNALRSGGLPGAMMRDVGLPVSAGTGVKQFLEALRALKRDNAPRGDGPGDDRMDTD